MKRFISTLVLVLLICSVLANITIAAVADDTASTDRTDLLSELDDELLTKVLESYGVFIPEGHLVSGYKSWIRHIEQYPFAPSAISYQVAADFYEQLRTAVWGYYGITSEVSALYTSRYTLQYSTLSNWDPYTMPYYNCFSYVLNITTEFTYVGYPSGNTYNDQQNVYVMADIVREDIKAKGKNCVKMDNSAPTSTVGWENLIAMRKGTRTDAYNDYHFAQRMASGWYHKPGNTAVLRFNSSPSYNQPWTNECYFNGVCYEPDAYYDSGIVYMIYKTNHGDLNYVYTWENYHQGIKHYYKYAYVCEDCGEEVSVHWQIVPCSGPPCDNRAE